MPTWITILWIAGAAIGAAVGLYWSVALRRTLRTLRTLPTARDGVALAAAQVGPGVEPPGVCVLVPAHNEAEVIGRLAESLVRQAYPRLRVLWVLDRCTDDTDGVLDRITGQDPRFRRLHVTSCPEGWAGKVHALWHAASTSPEAAEADLLLFTDADTIFDPRCIAATVALLQHRRLDLLSLLSTLESGAWFERTLQPAASLELARMYPPLKANAPEGSRPMANGQFLLFRREAYRAIGGHERVRDELLEDMALAEFTVLAGGRAGVLAAEGMLRCRMYPSFGAFSLGWRRIFTEIARRKPSRLRRAATIELLFHALLPTLAIATGVAWLMLGGGALATVAGILGFAGASVLATTLALTLRLSGAGPAAVVCYPASAAWVAWCLWSAARELEAGTPIRWGGREYVRQNRDKDPSPMRVLQPAGQGVRSEHPEPTRA